MLKFNHYRLSIAVLSLLLACSALGHAKKKAPKPEAETWKSDPQFDLVVDKITTRETAFVKNLREFTPMVETYIQNMRPDKDFGSVPVSDEYFLGRIKLEGGLNDQSFLPAGGPQGAETSGAKETDSTMHKIFGNMRKIVHLKGGQKNASPNPGYMSDGFAQMILIDTHTFDRQHYEFRFVRREFLGDVRTLVIDVKPKPQPSGKAMFIGRIWAEDQQYNIVRFNGTYTPHPKNGEYMHFDSWREDLGHTGDWLPAYVYSQETDLTRGKDHWDFRAQNLLWGYDVTRPNKTSEFTDIVVDTPPDKVKDQTDSKQDLTTVAAERAWQRQAEDNVLDRMQRAALLAPEGDVDKVLNTVVQNIEVTNNVEVNPDIRSRVLLTQPMESFTVGHTIVVSRGLLDALPDEASLAMILAHEMAHILLAHQINEKYAFGDQMIFPDANTIRNIAVKRTPEEEKEADAKALQLLQNSPYKDKLASAGLFLAAMQKAAPQLPNLLRGQFGNPLESKENGVRMSSLVTSAPELKARDVNQIAALPLGGRVKLNPWSDELSIQKLGAAKPLFASEKMPFQVTPMFPYLTRGGSQSAGPVSGAATPTNGRSSPSAEATPANNPPMPQPQPQ
jgi:hypothetical protein